MAGVTEVVSAPKTSNIWLDGIIGRTKWASDGESTMISYYIAEMETVYTASGSRFWAYDMGPIESPAIWNIMQTIESVCNIKFDLTDRIDKASIVWTRSDSEGEIPLAKDEFGYADAPGQRKIDGDAIGEDQSLIIINVDAYEPPIPNPDRMTQGSLNYCTFIHELGHALGLAHPHDDGNGSTIFPGVTSGRDVGYHNMNQGIYTMMSYNDGWQTAPHKKSPGTSNIWGYQGGPMALDIAALQRMYHANKSYRKGDDLYNIPNSNEIGTLYSCIWDAGGDDLIRGASDLTNIIDLRPATLKDAPGGGGYVSYAKGIHGGFTIANGVIIENATGGKKNDRLTGNSADNILEGLSGNDTLLGRGGNDRLYGGTGNDMLDGGKGNDRLFGNAGNDALNSGTGNDRLDGGAGRDVLRGGAGNDTLLGGAGNDRLYGDAGNDSLNAGGGNDLLDGGAGNDTLLGGAGKDTLDGGAGKDVLTGSAGADAFLFRSATDSTPGKNRDVITDFGRSDRIDLSALDANSLRKGNQDFDFSGTKAAAHSVWYVKQGNKVILRADHDGDARADFEVELTGIARLIADDFIL